MDPNPPDSFHAPSRPELAVLNYASQGLGNIAIGAKLGLSPLTVKSHFSRMAARYGAGHRAALISLAYQENWIHHGTPDQTLLRPTSAELTVIQQVANGATNKEIGQTLFKARETIVSRLKVLMRRYGIASRTELTSLAYDNNWLDHAEDGTPKVTAIPSPPIRRTSASQPTPDIKRSNIYRGMTKADINRRWPITKADTPTLAYEMSHRALTRDSQRASRAGPGRARQSFA